MRTKLTLLALLASASFMVQAQTPAAGNEPLNTAVPSTSSNTTRDAVENKAAAATAAGTVATGDNSKAPNTSTNSSKSRTNVMEKGTAAQNAGTIATGDGSANPSNAGGGMGQNKMHKSDKMHKSGKAANAKTGTNVDNVKSGNAPYTKTPNATSDKARSDVKAGTKMNGGVEGVAAGNQPIVKTPSTSSSTDRSSVQAEGKAAVQNDTLKTGDGSAKPAQ